MPNVQSTMTAKPKKLCASDLHDDIWMEIAEILHDDDYRVENLSSTCRRMRGLCVPLMFRSVAVNTPESLEKLYYVIEANPLLVQHVRKFTLYDMAWCLSNNQSQQLRQIRYVLTIAAKVGRTLRSFTYGINYFHMPDIVRTTPDLFNAFANYFRNVETVHVICMIVHPEMSRTIGPLLAKTSALKVLTIETTDTTSPSTDFATTPLPNTLRRLVVHDSYRPKQYAIWLSRMRALEHLDIHLTFAADEMKAFADVLGTVGEQLRHLTIYPGPIIHGFTDAAHRPWQAAVEKILKSCKALTHLQISSVMCTGRLVRNLPKALESVRLEGLGHGGNFSPAMYEDLCSAVMGLPRGTLKKVWLNHDYKERAEQDREVEDKLSKAILGPAKDAQFRYVGCYI